MGDKLRKFRLLGGGHTTQSWRDADPDRDANSNYLAEYKDPFTGKNKMRVLDRVTYEAGDIVESSRDLVALFGSNKFAEVHPEKAASVTDETRRLLERFSVADLRKLADEEEIDLGDVTKKDEIIDVVCENFALRSTAPA